MIYKTLKSGQIIIYMVAPPKDNYFYKEILSRYGNFKYIDEDIIEFETTCFDKKPNSFKARAFLEYILDNLNSSINYNRNV